MVGRSGSCLNVLKYVSSFTNKYDKGGKDQNQGRCYSVGYRPEWTRTLKAERWQARQTNWKTVRVLAKDSAMETE